MTSKCILSVLVLKVTRNSASWILCSAGSGSILAHLSHSWQVWRQPYVAYSHLTRKWRIGWMLYVFLWLYVGDIFHLVFLWSFFLNIFVLTLACFEGEGSLFYYYCFYLFLYVFCLPFIFYRPPFFSFNASDRKFSSFV